MRSFKTRSAWARGTLTTALLALAVTGVSSAQATPVDRFPSTAVEALAYYEADIDNWMDGPVQYIALDAEADRWKDLDTEVARKRFISWFWDRRDVDLRQAGNPFKEAFYAGVAEANRRFSGFPKGWESDRGRIWVTLGRPDNIVGRMARGGDVSIWVYFTNSRDRAYANAFGEMQVAFAKVRGTYEIAGGFAGLGSYPVYVWQAMEYTREASIVDPTIEFVAGLAR